jgi:hypothetical protein
MENDFSIFPNPSNGVINICSGKKIISLNIYNMIGNLVMVSDIYENNYKLNIDYLNEGIYFVEIKLDDGSLIKSRFIKK